MFGKLFGNLTKRNNQNHGKYYEKIKKLTKIIKGIEQKDNDIWCQNFMNNIRVSVWIEDNLTTINIKIVENTHYEFSLNFYNNKYTFIETSWDTNGSPNSKNLDTFEENIEIIFLDTISNLIEYLQDKLDKTKLSSRINEKKDKETVDNLVSTINDNEIRKEHKSTDLFTAIKELNVVLVKKILENGINIDKSDDYGYTPLMIAVKLNFIDLEKKQKQHMIIEELLKNGANVYHAKGNQNVMHIIHRNNDFQDIRTIFHKFNYFKNTQESNDIYLKMQKKSYPSEIQKVLNGHKDNLLSKEEKGSKEEQEINSSEIEEKNKLLAKLEKNYQELKNSKDIIYKELEDKDKIISSLTVDLEKSNKLIIELRKQNQNLENSVSAFNEEKLNELKIKMEEKNKLIFDLEKRNEDLQTSKDTVYENSIKNLNELVEKNEEINKLRAENESYKKTFENEFKILKESLLKKSDEIKELYLKLEKKDKFSKRLDSQTLNTINVQKNDGVIVKRDSFEDF